MPHEIDAELSFGKSQVVLDESVVQELVNRGYILELGVRPGWFATVSRQMGGSLTLTSTMYRLLDDLDLLLRELGEHKALLRIAVFYSTASCTLPLANDVLGRLGRSKLDIEVTVYPSND